MKLNGLSLFANVGMAETYLHDVEIDIKVANELLEERANFYTHLYPEATMIVGDITDDETYERVIQTAKKENVNFLIATPPCQGMSLAGKMDKDDVRNQLISVFANRVVAIIYRRGTHHFSSSCSFAVTKPCSP